MFRSLILAAALLALPSIAVAQTVTVTAPNAVNPSGQPTAIDKTFIVNADGTIATIGGSGGSSGSVAQGSTTAGQSGTLVQCTVVTGNQTYTIGTTNPLNCISTGRLKVAVSNAGNIDPATQLTTTLTADLVAAKYYATRPTWVDGATGVIQADATGNLYVNNATLPPGAATDATLAAQSAKLPASVGAKAGAASLSVVPNTDTPFPVVGNIASGTTDSGAPVKVGGVYNSTLPTYTAGQRSDLQVDSRGNLQVSLWSATTQITASTTNADGAAVAGALSNLRVVPFNYYYNGSTWDRQRGDTTGAYSIATPTASPNNSVAPVATSAVASSLTIKASAGNLYSVNIVTGATAGYLMIFNATAAPADGAVAPVKCLPVAANVGIETNMRSMPEYFSTGITAVFSSTGCFTKTASATAFISGDAK